MAEGRQIVRNGGNRPGMIVSVKFAMRQGYGVFKPELTQRQAD